MSECMICGKECTGKTCSGACRAKLSRIAAQQDINSARPGTLAHGLQAHGQAHAHTIEESARYDKAHAQPGQVVTGFHKSVPTVNTDTTAEHTDIELVDRSVRSRVGGCAVSIPGDEDYDGIVTKELAAERGWKLIPKTLGECHVHAGDPLKSHVKSTAEIFNA